MMIALYAISLVALLIVVGISLRRSEFGVLVLVAELPFLIGLCLYPLLFAGEMVTPGVEGQSYLYLNGPPGWVAAVHILCYSLLAATGYFLAIRLRFNDRNAIGQTLARIAKPQVIWHFLILYGLAVFGIFLLLVGPDVALANAILARGGDFEGFGDSAKYLFLKTLAGPSFFAACFIPYILVKHRGSLFFALYIVLIIIAYLNSISRNLILYQLILPLLIVIHAQGFGKKNVFLLFFVVMPVAFLTVFFGKTFGHFVSEFIAGGRYLELAVSQGDDGLLNSLLSNYEFVWFSVDAGWLQFVESGPTMPVDAFLAIIGFIPSRVLEALNVGWLYHGNAEVRMSCINAVRFGMGDCTVPPLVTGLSAYMAPVAGAIIAGFIRFYVYGRLDKMWLYYKRTDYSMTWVPYSLFIVFVGFTSFIPTSIALASFMVVLVCLALGIRSLIRFVSAAKFAGQLPNKTNLMPAHSSDLRK